MSFKITSLSGLTTEVKAYLDKETGILHLLDMDGEVSLTNSVENVLFHFREERQVDFQKAYCYGTDANIAEFDGGFRYVHPDSPEVYQMFRITMQVMYGKGH